MYTDIEKQYAKHPDHRTCIRACKKGYSVGILYATSGRLQISPWDAPKGNTEGHYSEYHYFHMAYNWHNSVVSSFLPITKAPKSKGLKPYHG